MLPRSLINITKTADPLALSSGPGTVTYTYQVTNPGTEALSDVTVSDDKLSPVSYDDGDVNADDLLQPDEIWIYTGRSYLERDHDEYGHGPRPCQ